MVSLERINEYLHLPTEALCLTENKSGSNKIRRLRQKFQSCANRIKMKKRRNLIVEKDQSGTFGTFGQVQRNSLVSAFANGQNQQIQKSLIGWPSAGEIVYVNYSARYRPDLSFVLHDINLTIHSGEKVAIVGRTGAGKTTLMNALFRLIEAAFGAIFIDSIDISTLNLHELRRRMTIIHQDPALFEGSLRQNLDPYNIYEDRQIWNALELAHLKNFASSLPLGLLQLMTEGGSNISVCERQLICLARAILRRSKILILDEATASIDSKTDELIQSTIRSEFKNSTVVTIAHRLNTIIDYDKVALLSNGKLIEYGSINEIISNKNSEFYKMAKEVGVIS